jgi:hypothetical protein
MKFKAWEYIGLIELSPLGTFDTEDEAIDALQEAWTFQESLNLIDDDNRESEQEIFWSSSRIERVEE